MINVLTSGFAMVHLAAFGVLLSAFFAPCSSFIYVNPGPGFIVLPIEYMKPGPGFTFLIY